MDTVFIRQLAVSTTIGVYDWEKTIKQQLLIDIDMVSDIKDAAASDNISDTVDYAVVSNTITDYVQGNQFELIETVAQNIADIILNDFPVTQVTITLQKPGAVKNAQSVGVKIMRQKSK
ncbi:MAG: dihydroneopterin aldolase [Psychrosphaera sp.]|nr:dihydroneopterin aldolase [Psychrosphaera sp.]